MSECAKYQELICSLVDEELNTQTREALLSHIEGCKECKALYEAFSALSLAVSEDIEEVPEALHENIMAGVRRSALRNKNKKRSIRQTRSLLAAAACFAVVIMSAVGISKTMESRKGDVINDASLANAETQAAAVDTAVTGETAPTAMPQANASTPAPKPASSVNPVSTPVPPVQESTEEVDEFGGMRESADEDAAASPVQSGVGGLEIPNAEITAEPASQVQSEPASQPEPQNEPDAQVQSEPYAQSKAQDEGAAQAAEKAETESAPADSAVSEQPDVNAATVDTQQSETPEDTGSALSDAASAPAVSDAAANAAEAAVSESTAPAAQEAKPGRFSSGFRGLFSALAPAATSAPEAEKLPEADVYFTLTGDKDYEELSKLLLGTLSELPIETPDRTYLISIERDENPIVLIMRAYGDKLYYSIYDELILQNVLIADCKPEALEKFLQERSGELAPLSETDTEIEPETSVAPAEQTPTVKISIGTEQTPDESGKK